MTLKQAYEYGQEQLKNAEIDDAALDAWYLLEYVTGFFTSLKEVKPSPICPHTGDAAVPTFIK